MKKIKKSAVIIAAAFLAFSCATTQLQEGEELVEYIDREYKIQNKENLTAEELRKDCDMLKYILYNTYAGIDEAIANGFDLDAAIEQIYEQSLLKKSLGTISRTDFNSAIHDVMAKNLTNNDLHLSIGGRSVKAAYSIYYTNIWMEKKGDKYFVKEIRKPEKDEKEKGMIPDENPDVKPGMEFTGPQTNLYEFITHGGVEYRYGVFTNKKVRTVQVSLQGKNFAVPISTQKPIEQKYAWTGVKSTDDTIYMSLGDCSQVNGIGDDFDNRSWAWDKYQAQLAENAKGKKNIIFDLRSNHGGRYEYPAKMLTSTLYCNHTDKDELLQIEALFNNTITDGCTFLCSPFTMQSEKNLYEKYWKSIFERMPEERQDFFKKYWKKMKNWPMRKHIPLHEYKCTLTEFPEPDFKGDIYVLVNRGTASAAEFGTGMTFLLQDKGVNVHIIGENSMGAFKYGGMNYNQLPVSGLGVSAGLYFGESASMKANKNWKGEGYGFVPDYYATNETILSTLILLTKDIQLADTLKGLEKEQL